MGVTCEMDMMMIFNLEKYWKIYVLIIQYIVVIMIILIAMMVDDHIFALMERDTH